MRRVVVLALLALALPMAAWADGITIVNQFGSLAISNSGITSTGSQLTQFDSTVAPKGHALGTVSYSTGALVSGSIAGGGVFSSAGSTFNVIGIGAWAKALTGETKNPISLFSGTFVGPITWTLTSGSSKNLTYTLAGDIYGQLWTGRFVNGTTVQNIFTVSGQLAQGIGHIKIGTTSLAVPEPGTLGLLGTGLLGMAGMFRRKLLGR